MTVELVVGRIGKPHGIRGDVTIDVRTDEPERRFAPGSSVSAGVRVLTVEQSRWHQGVLLLRFANVADRNAAEGLRNLTLTVEVSDDEVPAGEDEFYDHQLIGLDVVDFGGLNLGRVSAVLHGSQDILVVTRHDGGEGMVPFVKALVPDVDLTRGRLVVHDKPGLVTPFPEGEEDPLPGGER